MSSTETKLIFIRDRTVILAFDLHRDITGDRIFFAMKSDRNNDYYCIEPTECTITDACHGLFELTITNDMTSELCISKYYGELVRLTVEGSYQTLQNFDIDLRTEIISTRDIY